MSIRARFLLLIGVLSLIAASTLAFISYHYSVSNTFNEAKEKGKLIFDYLEASKVFFREEQRPLINKLVEEDRFYPELMSGFVMTRGVWDRFKRNNPDYIFKQATVDPLYPPNKADNSELKIIGEFRANDALKTSEGEITIEGEEYFYFARPIKVKSKCLRCHGDPADAPRDQVEIYGTAEGYHWKDGDTVAAFMVYIPIAKALAKARQSGISLFIVGIAGIVILMTILWFFFDRSIISPITLLKQAATDISLGKNLKTSIGAQSKDEIGALSRALDRLRISVDRILERRRGQ
ncbi:MAG: DUF3365 domain-containing protein [Thermodesulfobacteriota bacterium]